MTSVGIIMKVPDLGLSLREGRIDIPGGGIGGEKQAIGGVASAKRHRQSR